MRSFRASRSTTAAGSNAQPSESAQSEVHATGTAEPSAARPRVLAGLLNRKRRVEDAKDLMDERVRKELRIAQGRGPRDAEPLLDPNAALGHAATAQELIASLFPAFDECNREHAAFISDLLRTNPTVSDHGIGPLYANGVLSGLALAIATDGDISRACAAARHWYSMRDVGPAAENREIAADIFETHCVLAEIDGGEAVLDAMGRSKWWSPVPSQERTDRLLELRAARWVAKCSPAQPENRPTSLSEVVDYVDQIEPSLTAPAAPTSKRKSEREEHEAAAKRYNVYMTASRALRALHAGGPRTAADETAIMGVRSGIEYAAEQTSVDNTFNTLFTDYASNPSFLQKTVSPSKAMPLANGNAQTAVFILNVLNKMDAYLEVRFEDPGNTSADKTRIAIAMAMIGELRTTAGKKGWYEAKEKQAAKAARGEAAQAEGATETTSPAEGASRHGARHYVRHRIFMRHVRENAAQRLGVKKKQFRKDPESKAIYSEFRARLKEMDALFDGEALVRLIADAPLTEHVPNELSELAAQTYVVEAQKGLDLLESKPSDAQAFVELVGTIPPGEKQVLHARAKRGLVLAQWIHLGVAGHVPALWQVVEDVFTRQSSLQAMILSALAATATLSVSRMWGGGGQIEVEGNDEPGARHITIKAYETSQVDNEAGVGSLFKGVLVGRAFSWLSGKFQFTRSKEGKNGFEWRFPARDGESYEELRARVSEAMNQLFDREPGASATDVIASLGSDVTVSVASGQSSAVGTNFQVGTVGAVELTELPSWAGISRPLGRGDARRIGQSSGLDEEYDVQLSDSIDAGTAFAGQTVPRWGRETVHGPLGESQRSFNTPSWVYRFTRTQLPKLVQRIDTEVVPKVVRNFGKRTLGMTLRIASDGVPVRISRMDKKGLQQLQNSASGKTGGLLPDGTVALPSGMSNVLVTQKLDHDSRNAFRAWATATEMLEKADASLSATFGRIRQTADQGLAGILGDGPHWVNPTVVEASATTSTSKTTRSMTQPYLGAAQATSGVDVTRKVRIAPAIEPGASGDPTERAGPGE